MANSDQGPEGLRPPGDDTVSVWISVDLGGDRDLGDAAGYLTDLATLVDVGQRWGVELARAAIDWANVPDFEEAERLLHDVERALRAEGFHLDRRRGPRFGPFEWWGWAEDIEWRTLRDIRARPLLGTRTVVSSVRYENPLELVLAGSGMFITGVVFAARTLRDWSNSRRVGEATAREAEAEARMTEARADLYEHLVAQAKEGQTPVPVGDLVQIVTPPEIKALNRLAERPIAVELGRASADQSPDPSA